MKSNWIVMTTLLALACSPAFAADADSGGLGTQRQKVSYIIGLQIAQDLKQHGIDIDQKALDAGIRDTLAGKTPALSEKQIDETMATFKAEMEAKQGAAQDKASPELKAEGDKTKKEGEAFLAANKTKEGVKTTASGLQYKVITEGKGKTPTANDTVTVNYRGTLINGTEFDSSYKRGQPATFPVSGVIKGWTEALQMMPIGSKWQLFIPAALAYGERQVGKDIPPNSTLVFDVELISSP